MTDIIAEADLEGRLRWYGPSMVECAYLDQGYQLPKGWTWPEVALYRQALGFDPELVPAAPRTDERHRFAWTHPVDLNGQPLMTDLVRDFDFIPKGD